MEDRIIGEYTGKIHGPLVIGIGGIHGNEPAGIEALELLFKMLEVEPITNPDFQFKGRLIGLRGNLRALEKGQRFIVKDLNRQWTEAHIDWIRTADEGEMDEEDKELKSLLHVIESAVEDYQPEQIILIDFHTTTAFGGIFTISTNDPESLSIATALHAPVITGLLKGIRGTTLHYFHKNRFKVKTTAVCFESGQHDEPLSVNRAIAAMVNCLRTLGCVKQEDVEHQHDAILQAYSKGLPKVAQLITTHPIQAGDEFQMVPNYQNFQKVKAGEVLAYDKNGAIKAPTDSMVLMPLYQKQGDDGFFLIRSLVDF